MHVLKRYQWSGFQNLWILEDWRTKLRKCIYSSKVSPQLKFFVSTLPLRCHCCHHWTLRLLALNLMPLDKNLHCLIVITLLAQCSQTWIGISHWLILGQCVWEGNPSWPILHHVPGSQYQRAESHLWLSLRDDIVGSPSKSRKVFERWMSSKLEN